MIKYLIDFTNDIPYPGKRHIQMFSDYSEAMKAYINAKSAANTITADIAKVIWNKEKNSFKRIETIGSYS